VSEATERLSRPASRTEEPHLAFDRLERRRRFGKVAVSTASVVAFVLVWEALTASGAIDPAFFPSPTRMAGEAAKLVASFEIFWHIGVSTERVLVGFALSALVAIPLGIALGVSPLLKAIADPLVSIVRPLPSLSWIPLSILWFGIGESQKYAIVFMGTVAPLLIYVTDATLRVEPILIKAARNLGATRLQVMTQVILPAALPNILTGLKVSLALAWMCIISAEMVGASKGLGFLIWNAKDWANMPQVLVGMVAISLTVLLLDIAFRAIEDRLMPWKAHERK
jgi:taurine transport system permease protein